MHNALYHEYENRIEIDLFDNFISNDHLIVKAEVDDWCNRSLSGKWDWGIEKCFELTERRNILVFFFEDISDAILFKLTWL
jgi:hypothetical protein